MLRVRIADEYRLDPLVRCFLFACMHIDVWSCRKGLTTPFVSPQPPPFKNTPSFKKPR
jgi:hypothetical protein